MAIVEGRYTSLAAQDLAVTMEMRRVINDICECKKSGELKRLFTESKILELLMPQLEQIQLGGEETGRTLIRAEDIEKLYHAKELLDRDYANPPTIRELSRQISFE